MYSSTLGNITYQFKDLKTLMAKATPFRSGDELAEVTADNYRERVAAQVALANLPLAVFLNELVIPYETDDVSRLIIDNHDKIAFSTVSGFTIGSFRDWLLLEETDNFTISKIRKGLTPEMIAAVSKIMRNQDLI